MIVAFEAYPSRDPELITEFFEFDEYTLGALLNDYLEQWCNNNTPKIQETACWYKVEIINGEDVFE